MKNNSHFIKNEEANNSVRFYYNDKGEKTSALFTKFGEDGKVVLKIWKDFDASGRTIRIKASNGYMEQVEYEKGGKKTVKKTFPDGTIAFVKYDKNGNEIKEKPEKEKCSKSVSKNHFSLISVIQYCSLGVMAFVGTTLLWEQLDVMQFGASLPSNADTISSVIITLAALGILYFKNKK